MFRALSLSPSMEITRKRKGPQSAPARVSTEIAPSAELGAQGVDDSPGTDLEQDVTFLDGRFLGR